MSGTTREKEFARYSGVIHLRSPGLAQGYNHSNPVRTESDVEAQRADERLLKAWEGHPHRLVIESADDFLIKAAKAIEAIQSHLPSCCKSHDWKL